MATLDSLKQRLLKHARRKDRLPDDQVKTLTVVLAALRVAEKSVIETIAAGDLSVAAAASREMRDPEYLPAIRAMAIAAIEAATRVLAGPAPETATPTERPLPDGWPDGWTPGRVGLVGGGAKHFAARDGQPTALRWDTEEEARRDAWERVWQHEEKTHA